MNETQFKGIIITRQKVLDELRNFEVAYPDTNQYKRWLENNAHKYAIEFNEKLYPPKHILRGASGLQNFYGGDATNNIFTDLDFTIIKKPGLLYHT